MTRHSFFCIDGHTCGNPVRLVAGGGPQLERRHDEREAPAFHRRIRLDPHRTDVRAARPRHHVGLDPLSADARRLRHRDPVHRDVRLPADVRARHHRHGDDGDRAGAGHAEGRRAAAARHAGRRRRRRISARRPLCGGGQDHQRPVLPALRPDSRWNVRGSARLVVDVAYGGNFYAIVEAAEELPRHRGFLRRRADPAAAR